MAISFESQGFVVVGPRDDAEIYLINTCTVTAEADRKVRQWLRWVRRSHPGSLVVASGCGVARDRRGLESLADVLIDNRDKAEAVALVASQLRTRRFAPPRGDALDRAGATGAGRTRSLVKVQEGCATPCAFCVVPLVRGREVSIPIEQVLATIHGRIVSGSKEIVLTGTKIGAYRDGEADLVELVSRILTLPGLKRLRLSSLQPEELSDELLALWRDDRLCCHFHLSLQSGSDSVLGRMGRRYRTDDYQRAVERIRSVTPGAAITTDVIAGFPGETDEEFGATTRFCEDIGFARIHVFPYSRRPGTPAAGMSGQLSAPVLRQRCRDMESVAEESHRAYVRSWLRRQVEVLWEEETQPGSGVYAGTTGNYLRVLCYSSIPVRNALEKVTLARPGEEGVWVRRNGENQGGCEAKLEGSRC